WLLYQASSLNRLGVLACREKEDEIKKHSPIGSVAWSVGIGFRADLDGDGCFPIFRTWLISKMTGTFLRALGNNTVIGVNNMRARHLLVSLEQDALNKLRHDRSDRHLHVPLLS